MLTRILLVLAATTATAAATGVCENMPRSYDPPRLYAEASSSFAIPGHQAWCDESDDLQETRGTVDFVELRRTDGKVDAILSTARGKDAGRVKSLVGTFEAATAAKLATVLQQRGFAPLVPSATGCTAKLRWTPAAAGETVNGFPASRLNLDIVRAGKRLVTLPLELGATERKDAAALRISFVAAQRAIAMFVRVPTCSGGPPPGYFSPDDGGVCYQDDQVVVKLMTAAATPALAGCFKTP